jgi:hypothetical protein
MPPELRHLQAFLAVADQKLVALDPRPHVICRPPPDQLRADSAGLG